MIFASMLDCEIHLFFGFLWVIASHSLNMSMALQYFYNLGDLYAGCKREL